MPQPAPTPFGKYLLLDRIAAGGMAEIYRARLDAVAGVSKQLVIKKILPHYAGNKNFVAMFINEAKIVAGLSHGNIAQIFDFGEVGGEYFLAMEFVHGQTLSRVMRRARQSGLATLPTAFALYIVMELCKGLHYAHTRLDEQARPLNIIHRDVSPQNVLVSYEGEIKIVDFGIAKARVAGQTETEAGAVKGKYTYFAPEQARGKELDARADVFAAGIVLYEMVCGRLPFEGKMVDVLTRIVKGEFERPRTVNPDVPPALERILLTSLATERSARYASAQAFQEAVATYLYANAPAFSASTLAQLMTYLFEPELSAEGRPIHLPRDFGEQLLSFKKPMSRQPESSPRGLATSEGRLAALGSRLDEDTDRDSRRSSLSETPAPSGSDGDGRSVQPSETVLEDERSVRSALSNSLGRLPPHWVLFSAPVLAMALAATVVFGVGHFSTFAVQLTSTPAGAHVKVDGRSSPMTTPLLISDLSADRPHVLELSAPDRKLWRQEVTPARGRTLPIHAALELAHPAGSPEPVLPRRPATRRLPNEVFGPGTYVLSASQHAFPVSSPACARMRLDGRKRYTARAEGKLSLGAGVLGLSEAVAFLALEGTGGDTTVVVGKRPVTVRGAAWLFAFIPDSSPADNAGLLSLRIQENGKEALTLVLDAKQHAFPIPPEHRLRIAQLDPSLRYELQLREGEAPPRLSQSGRPLRVLVIETGANPKRQPVRGLRVLSLDSRVELTGASALTLAIPDDNVEDNSGSAEVQLTAVSKVSGGSPARISP